MKQYDRMLYATDADWIMAAKAEASLWRRVVAALRALLK